MCISTTFNPKQVPYLYVLPVVLWVGKLPEFVHKFHVVAFAGLYRLYW